MVKEKELLNSKKYKFKHIVLEVNEKDENDEVHLFNATYVKTSLPGKMSDSLMEINITLWDQNSTKRPPGYYIVGQKEISPGVFKSFMISGKYIKKLDEMQEKYGFK